MIVLNSWEVEGPRLKGLTESSESVTELAEVVLEATGISERLGNSDLPYALRWAAVELANCVLRVDRQYRFAILARYVAGKTLEEIASSLNVTRQRVSQILLRESAKVFSGLSFENPSGDVSGEGMRTESKQWMLPSWVHSISAIQSASQRASAAIIYGNLINAANSEVPQGEESPWRPFVLSGLIPSQNLLETRRKPHSGYLLPNWVSSLKKGIPKSDEVIYWHTSARGPVPARGTGILELERPEILALLAWADLVHWDTAGPKSAAIMLRNEVDSAQLELRLLAAMMTGRHIPIPIMVVLPSTGKVAELNWSTLDMEGMEIDPATFEQSISKFRESGSISQGDMTPSVLQEVWHVYEGNLREIMCLVDSNLRQHNSVGTLLWGRYRPIVDGGAIRLVRI